MPVSPRHSGGRLMRFLRSETVVVDFHCRACLGPVTATLRCEGDLRRLTKPPCIPLACPHCGHTNDVTFDARGEVLAVAARRRGEPVWN